MVHHASLLHFPISRPRSDGPFVELLMDFGEACFLDLGGHRVEGVDASTGSLTAGQHVRTPVVQDVIGR